MRSRVVLPAPLGPSRATTRGGGDFQVDVPEHGGGAVAGGDAVDLEGGGGGGGVGGGGHGVVGAVSSWVPAPVASVRGVASWVPPAVASLRASASEPR